MSEMVSCIILLSFEMHQDETSDQPLEEIPTTNSDGPFAPEQSPPPTFLVQSLDLQEKTISVGSFVQFWNKERVLCNVVITQLLVHPEELRIEGFELLPSSQSQPKKKRLGSLSVFNVLQGIERTFVVVPAWMEKDRSFWPDFVYLAEGIPPAVSSPIEYWLSLVQKKPSQSLRCEYQHVLSEFSAYLLKGLRKFLNTRTMSEKVICEWFPLDPAIQSFFGLGEKKNKIRLDKTFSPLSELLGDDHFFLDEQNYSCEGWGFLKEKHCHHFIVQVVLCNSEGHLKCKAHQILQNPISKIFQGKLSKNKQNFISFHCIQLN